MLLANLLTKVNPMQNIHNITIATNKLTVLTLDLRNIYNF